MKVKNLIGSSDNTCYCDSWLEHWEKYNNGGHINLDDIPIEDTELALKEFSCGSVALEMCLRVLWM